MSIAAILLLGSQLVQLGFSLNEIATEVRGMEDKGATDKEIHDYLLKLMDDKQAELEVA